MEAGFVLAEHARTGLQQEIPEQWLQHFADDWKRVEHAAEAVVAAVEAAAPELAQKVEEALSPQPAEAPAPAPAPAPVPAAAPAPEGDAA